MSATTRVRALRGAITVDADDSTLILEATRTLLREMLLLNSLESECLVSVIFTATPDLTAAFPARAARELGWNDVPLLCMTEMTVPGSLPRCVRVLMHAELPVDAGRGRHVYLGAAAELRPDLATDGVRSLISSRLDGDRSTSSPRKRGPMLAGSRNVDSRFRGNDANCLRGDDV